jgi:hypothetical protein
LNQHVDEHRAEYAHNNSQLIERDAAAANPRRCNLGNIIRRNHRCRADTQSADEPEQNEFVQISGKEHAERRRRETQRTQRKPFFLSQKIGDAAGRRAADDAAHQCASRRPSDARSVQME